jgi:hypothetical protein
MREILYTNVSRRKKSTVAVSEKEEDAMTTQATNPWHYDPLPRSAWKDIPEIVEYRSTLAKMYRQARTENRELALLLLLRKRIKAAEQLTKDQIAERIFSHGTI